MRKVVIFDKENVEARVEAQFSALAPVMGQECVDILTDKVMAIITEETNEFVDASLIECSVDDLK